MVEPCFTLSAAIEIIQAFGPLPENSTRRSDSMPQHDFKTIVVKGLDWLQIRKLIHGLVNKGRVLGMDLVEIAPSFDVGRLTLVHAERLICNFIGACVRAGYYA